MSKMSDYFRELHNTKEEREYWKEIAWILANKLSDKNHNKEYWINIADIEYKNRMKQI